MSWSCFQPSIWYWLSSFLTLFGFPRCRFESNSNLSTFFSWRLKLLLSYNFYSYLLLISYPGRCKSLLLLTALFPLRTFFVFSAPFVDFSLRQLLIYPPFSSLIVIILLDFPSLSFISAIWEQYLVEIILSILW